MLPEKFLERMQNMLGEEYPAFLESLSGKRYRALRLNPLKTRIQEGKEKLPFTLSPVPWTKNGFITKRRSSRESILTMRRACTTFRNRPPWRRYRA